MREETRGGVTLRYPDAIGFAFNPCMVVAKGSEVSKMSVELTGEDGTVLTDERDALGGGCYADLREYIQSFFDVDAFGSVDYEETERTKQGQHVLFEVVAGGVTFDFSVFYVWGAMKAYGNEVYNKPRTLVAFVGYPFTAGVYIDGADTITVKKNGTTNDNVEVEQAGIYNFPIQAIEEGDRYSIADSNDTMSYATFDETFDLTFRMLPFGQSSMKVEVGEDVNDGVYLRWIDRHGFYRYWLFKRGVTKVKTGNEGQFLRNNIISQDMEYGYVGGLGRQMVMTRDESISVCASLIDSDTWDMLSDMASSPFVDMFTGYVDNVPQWVSVQISTGTHTRERAALQDFEAEVVLPSVGIQNL